MRRLGGVLVLLVGFVLMAVNSAYATPWYSGITLETTPVTTVAGVVATALAAIWAIRKVIKLFNKS